MLKTMFFIFALVGFGACQAHDMNPDTLNARLQSRLRVLAGQGAVTCGEVAVKTSAESANACARKAFHGGKPFFVTYQLEGIDSAGATALAMDSHGELYTLESDSIGFGPPFRAGTKVEEDGHILVEPCPKPYRLDWYARGKWLTCFLVRPPSEKQ